MQLFLQDLANGVLAGGILAVAALGFSLVWGILNIINLAHGAFVMLGACPPGADPASAPFNHAADAVFDDSVLADGVTLLAELALRTLDRG